MSQQREEQLNMGLAPTTDMWKSVASAQNGVQPSGNPPPIELQDPPRSLLISFCAVGLSFLSLLLIIVYETKKGPDYPGGVGWIDNGQLIAYHAIFMTAGLLTGATASMHAWGLLGAIGMQRMQTKGTHIILFSLSIVFIILGMYAINKSNCVSNGDSAPACYVAVTGLHSMLGILALVIFLGQYLVAACIYGLGIGGAEYKKMLYRHHRKIGIIALTLSTVNILVGMNMQSESVGSCDLPPTDENNYALSHYSDLSPACKIINGAGLSAAISLVLSLYTLIK